MKRPLFVLATLAVFAVLNHSIYQKEQLKAHGETMLLELAPVDPRSLMQGDYMALRYAIERNIPRDVALAQKPRGSIVVAPDADHVAQFVRFHADEPLQPGETLIPYQVHAGSVRISPDAFFFQEGHAEYYQAARYGAFKVDGRGGLLLTGLASKDRAPLPAQTGP